MEEHQEQDLAHIHWSWPERIAAFPERTLANADVAMDYFACSPFFDAGSNNSALRTQRQVENPTYGSAQEKVELLAFRGGFEYIVAHARAPEVFVIHRRPVLPDGGRGTVTHAYFILDGKIYLAPNLHKILGTRLRNVTALLERTFDALERTHPPANPRAAAAWLAAAPEEKKSKDKDAKEAEAAKDDDTDAAAATAAPDWHLANALAATHAALPSLDKLAASAGPAHDDAAEAKTLEALAQATARPNAAPVASGNTPAPTPGSLGLGLGPAQTHSPATPMGLTGLTPRPRLGSISLGGLNSQNQPGSRPTSTFAPSLPADSPKM